MIDEREEANGREGMEMKRNRRYQREVASVKERAVRKRDMWIGS